MSTYKRYGTKTEVSMAVDFSVSKEWLCELLGIRKKAILYIQDEEGSTLVTLVDPDAEFLPPGGGIFIVKTGEDLQGSSSDNQNLGVSKGMKANRRKFRIDTIPIKLAVEIVKKVPDAKAFSRLPKTCRWFNYVSEEYKTSFKFPVNNYLHVAINEPGGGKTGILSKNENYMRTPEDGDKTGFEYNLSDLAFLQPFVLKGVKIDQPNRRDGDEEDENVYAQELQDIALAVAGNKLKYKELCLANCNMKEVIVALGAFKPKIAHVWFCSFNSGRLDMPDFDDIEEMWELKEATGGHLPDETKVVTTDFDYLLPNSKSLFEFLGEYQVYLAVAKEPDLHFNPVYEFLNDFGKLRSLGANQATQFVYLCRNSDENVLEQYMEEMNEYGLTFKKKEEPGNIFLYRWMGKYSVDELKLAYRGSFFNAYGEELHVKIQNFRYRGYFLTMATFSRPQQKDERGEITKRINNMNFQLYCDFDLLIPRKRYNGM